eukprot:9164968-Ditylum_brightwellii.AAC.1
MTKQKHHLLNRTAVSDQQEGQKQQQKLQSSYPTTIVEGTVTAIKLQTYLNFPVSDPLLDTLLTVDLELSYNLWLCGDGIDILPQLTVKAPPSSQFVLPRPGQQKE